MNIVKNVTKFVKQNKASISIAAGIIGFISTIPMTIKATRKASKVYDSLSAEEKASKKIVFKKTWKFYIPTAMTSIASTAFVMLGHKTSAKQYTALASAYAISEKVISKYEAKVIEQIGEVDHSKFKKDVLMESANVEPRSLVGTITPPDQEYLVFDTYTGRTFKSTITKLRNIQAEANMILFKEVTITYNELCDLMGLDRVDAGTNTGWEINENRNGVEFHFDGCIIDGTPGISLELSPQPYIL